MIAEDFQNEIFKLKENLPINYQFIKSHTIDKNDTIRSDKFGYYNSAMSVCKEFHRPISKLNDKEGKI
jgi:hypothetical protein